MSNIFAVPSTHLLASFHGFLHSLPRVPYHVPHAVLIIHNEQSKHVRRCDHRDRGVVLGFRVRV